MDTISPFAAASGRCHHNKGGGGTVLCSVHGCCQIEEVRRSSIDNGLIASQFDFERGPAVWCFDDGIDFFAAVGLPPGVHSAV